MAGLVNYRVQKECGNSSWFGFAIILTGRLVGRRDDIIKRLRECDVEVRPIVAGNFTKSPAIRFLEYDIYGMACLYIELPLNYKYKVDEIISYIMNEKFSQVQDRYGILSDKNRYWALGWDPKPSKLEETRGANPLLLKMDLLSNFTIASQTEWFSQALELTNSFVDDKGIYHYPICYLTEKNACWILGNHMGLGENRKKKNALKIEGTFRTLDISNNLKKLEKAVDKADSR